jgi:mannose-1-phosphate guanylyltransferase
MEAILLVGGQGTRLRPLTISTPKPMLQVAGHPCTEHQIAQAKEAGVDRIILGTSYKAEVFEEYFGQGENAGVELVYAVESEPLGTGGAIRNAANFLKSNPDDPIIIFNGDVLTGLDIKGLVDKWRNANADVAIYLTRVEDPRAYGLVPTDEKGNVQAFLEKPTTPEEIITDQINAGCYIFKRSVIDQIPAGRPVSVERETFPDLLAKNSKVIGVVDSGYWLDLGTPLAFAKGSADLVQGLAPSPILKGATGSAIVSKSAQVDESAIISGGSFIGNNVKINSSSRIIGSVILDDVEIERGCNIENSIISRNTRIGKDSVVKGSVVAENVVIGPRNEFLNGSRIFPNSEIAEASIRFSSDKS